MKIFRETMSLAAATPSMTPHENTLIDEREGDTPRLLSDNVLAA
jgi:hypothetical protein